MKGGKHSKKPGGTKPRRPGELGKHGRGANRGMLKKRKAPEAPVAHAFPAAAKEKRGDDDDFAHMLDEMEDYAGPADGSDGELHEPQQLEQREGSPAGSGSDGGEAAAGQAGTGSGEGGAEGRKAKRRRKRGQKLSALEFEASRELARQIAECSAEEQADWLWASYQQHAAASALERGGLAAERMAPLPAQGTLEERLKALQPASWQQEFCNGGGGGGGGRQQGGAQQGARPPGSPSLLLISPSAIGAVGLIKLCPQFNKHCKIGKLFAKHFKVAEQEEVLRSQVMCIAAGTPNRLCKLADSGALKLDKLRHVVLDCALDAKQRDILAIPETRSDWWQLYDRHFRERLAAGTLRLSLVNSDGLHGRAGSGGGGGGAS